MRFAVALGILGAVYVAGACGVWAALALVSALAVLVAVVLGGIRWIALNTERWLPTAIEIVRRDRC